MKKRLCFVLLGISIMLGCYGTARFYPVRGPLSAQKRLPVHVAKFSGGFGNFNSGNISVLLSDGEVCKGRWAIVPKVPKRTTTPAATTTNDMSSAWDTVYGQGFYVSHVLGARIYARAVASGNRGTVLEVEMYRPETEHGESKGVARDNKENVYKIVFD